MTTANAHTDIHPLSSEQIETVSGALGSFATAFRIPLVLQVIPTDPCKRRTEVRDSHDRHANIEQQVER